MSKRDSNAPVLPGDITAAMLEALAPAAPPSALRARVLARVAASGAVPDFRTLRDTDGWRVLAPGLEYKLLDYSQNTDNKSFLLRAAAGSEFPGHTHAGDEECIVLEGEFSMGDLTLRAGDFHFAPRGSHHPDAHTRSGALVYLSASAQDYPLVVP
ncbi:MAG: cupin domain-containing protein [Gammaproteobacteria bacterium]|nr:cupin domain-containing protein [Gammaproteobacteria bacterium]